MSSVIITGASDGIGKELAFAFARRGYKLGLMARRKEKLQEVATECSKLGAKFVVVEATDVTDLKHFRTALEKIDQLLMGTEIFIANAGIGLNGSLRDEYDLYQKTFSVNFLGAVSGLEIMKVKMLERKKGTLVGVSSVAGARGMPVSGAYSSSKAALTIYLESLRIDLSPHNIKVLTIAPGFIKTAMTDQNTFKMPFIIQGSEAAEIFVKKILQGKELIIAPWQFRPIMKFLLCCPDFLYYFFMKRAAQVKARKHVRKTQKVG
ncbi:MAG: SDR family NAD(P)-dependent oxidoreductase [Bacteriovoracaceae bacterium]